jgi:hypothetical protein
MTPSQLRSISRQLYAEPAQTKPTTFADSKPMVRPSDVFKTYDAIQCAPMMRPNTHERAEWLRFADALNAADKHQDAAEFRVAASGSGFLSIITLKQFDALQAKYRAWLVYGTL